MTKTILHIAEAPGGVERYLSALLTRMKNYPEFEHVLVCSPAYNVAKFEGVVQSAIVISPMHNAISPILDCKAIICARRIIRDCNPDIVYCHSSKAGAIGRIASFGLSSTIIYNAHGWSFNIKGSSRLKTKIYELVERALAFKTDIIVCISEYERESALKHRICPSNKITVINNGIDANECEKTLPKQRNELGIPDDAFVVGAIGRLSPQKASDVFVKTAIEVKKSIPEAFFLMVGDDIGDGEYRNEIEEQIRKAGLRECFLITGWVDNPLDYACVFDVATLLSRWEGFGLVLLEYMYMGKPIVATRADAIPCVVGDAGILVSVDDHMQASEAIVKIKEDVKFTAMIRDRARDRVKLFDIQKTAELHASLFRCASNGKV